MEVGIIGASGYTGAELLRLLSRHPYADVSYITAHEFAGRKVGELYPHLWPLEEMRYEEFDPEEALGRAEAFFICLPHGKAMRAALPLLEKGARVFDLSADFRLRDPSVFREWYGVEHAAPSLLGEAVYGLPELNREALEGARLVAVPGCYPTAALLAVAPALRRGWLEGSTVIVDAKSGISGAGRGLSLETHYPQCDASIRPYGVNSHRHIPEMEQVMGLLAGEAVRVLFTPQLAPMSRGILSNAYLQLGGGAPQEMRSAYEEDYGGEAFVRILPEGQWPQTKAASGTNLCLMGLGVDVRSGWAVISTAIDNLVKGASGQAIQCMNLVMGFEETAGLEDLALFP